jgi:hypothetical protein
MIPGGAANKHSYLLVGVILLALLGLGLLGMQSGAIESVNDFSFSRTNDQLR